MMWFFIAGSFGRTYISVSWCKGFSNWVERLLARAFSTWTLDMSLGLSPRASQNESSLVR